jgi:hypothetical protein
VIQPAAATGLRGGCHCGRLRIAFDTAQMPETLRPRVCDCGFCRKHGAAWLSDPAGRLRVDAEDIEALSVYRQGSETARFLLCARCGVLIATVLDANDERFAALNASCLDGEFELGASVPISPQRLSAAEKIERWRSLWTRDVALPETFLPAIAMQEIG